RQLLPRAQLTRRASRNTQPAPRPFLPRVRNRSPPNRIAPPLASSHFPECSAGILPETPLLRVYRIATLAAARADCSAPLTDAPFRRWSAHEESGRKRRNHDGNAHICEKLGRYGGDFGGPGKRRYTEHTYQSSCSKS